MLGGSEDDLCRPVRSKGLGFQVLDAEPPGPDNWTGDEMGKKEMGVIKMKKKGRLRESRAVCQNQRPLIKSSRFHFSVIESDG